jgi:two-component system sensor histidine kinase RstB
MARMRFALEMHEGTTDFPDESKQEVSEALEELDGLVTEVLRYARLQRSAPVLQTSRVLLTDMVHESVAAVQALRPEVVVSVDNPYRRLELLVDPVQFQRALRNLVSNALKYTHDTVAVACDLRQDELIIRVDDNGPGIDEAARKRILAPFVRIDSSRTRRLGGAGLGLAIVNGVMTKHGGRVEISDSNTGGASFRMILPASCYLYDDLTPAGR